jgi:cobalt/nickel transport system permease protein
VTRFLRRWLHALSAIALVAGVPIALTAWHAGARAALHVGLRVVAMTSLLAIVLTLVSFPSLLRALAKLRVPSEIVELLGLAHRYVAVLGETLRTAREAQRIRGGRGLGVLAGVTLARAYDRTQTLGDALALRGGWQ